jgi:UDP-glucuronate 4-epimerase
MNDPCQVMVTGSAGFIGSALTSRLLARGDRVVGIDNLNDYYDPALKRARLARYIEDPRYVHLELDLADRPAMELAFRQHSPRRVVNLAAQAGVRYSISHPHAYVSSNVGGFLNVLEGCRNHRVEHLVFASTSSVYGANARMPFCEAQATEHPLTLYAATKKANEMMAHSYASLYRFPCSGLRFFTVYGPWGRPDMALFLFTKAILAGEPVKLFNYGRHRRSFTYIDDVVDGIIAVLDSPAAPDESWSGREPNPATSQAPYRILNIGNPQVVNLGRYVRLLEEKLQRTATIEYLPLQAGDVPESEADIRAAAAAVGYAPAITVEEGVGRFVDWYLDYYGVPG